MEFLHYHVFTTANKYLEGKRNFTKKNSNFKTRKEQLLMFWVNQCKSKLVIVTTLQDVLIVNLSIQS